MPSSDPTATSHRLLFFLFLIGPLAFWPRTPCRLPTATMGNQPSTTKESGGHHARDPNSPKHPSSHSHSHLLHHQKSNTTSTRAPITVHNHRAAAPAQASLAQAHGSTDIKNSQALPITSLAASPVGSTKSGSGAVPSRPIEPKQSVPVPVPVPVPSKDKFVADANANADHDADPDADPDADTFAFPTQPVDVPNPNNAATAAGGVPATAPVGHTSPLSPFDASEVGLHSHGSMSNMSFISRPPRLPLPIEEEVHTPGSPIIAPADNGDTVDAVELDGDGTMARKSSNLSTTTIDEDDAEELRVDKTRPTVPTRLEWLRGGERVYVTGTIFQWNRKQRLHPV